MKALPMFAATVAACFAATSCMTTYDSYGRPVQSVDPGAAAAIAVGAAAVGYAAGNNNGHRHHHYHGGYYYAPRPHYGHYHW